MRVAHVVEEFSRLSETFIYWYIDELERQGVDVRILTFHRANETGRPFAKVSAVPIPSRLHPVRLGYRGLAAAGLGDTTFCAEPPIRRRLARAVRALAPDLIHAHFGPMGVRAAPVARSLGIPLVVAFYGNDASQLLRLATWRKEYARMWSSAAAVLVLSEHMRAALREAGCPPERISVVRLGTPMRTPPRTPPGQVRDFISVGRLVPKKGFSDLLEAVRLLIDRGHALRLQIIGEGPLESVIRGTIAEYGLHEHVELTGALANDVVHQRLLASDAFVLCSRTAPDGDQEGTPTVLLEAQAAGLPCVSTRHAGIPEMIPAGNHWLLADEGDVAGIAGCMERLIQAEPETVAEVSGRGREQVEREFCLARQAARMRSVYAACRTPGAEVAPLPAR